MAGLIATGKSSLYSAAKFAAIGFRALRLELMPYGVYVTTVNQVQSEQDFSTRPTQMVPIKSVERFLLKPDAVWLKD